MSTYNTTTTATFIMSFILVSSILLIDLPFASALDCTPGHECYYAQNLYYPNRKILMGLSKPERPNYDQELRNVPSGPDPLHHSGGPQKRPRISP